ncbi:MAG: hypothetical protein IJ538_00755 [Clostridia bacterium]|nr:hypothetical protein [Clostridia bacterium]
MEKTANNDDKNKKNIENLRKNRLRAQKEKHKKQYFDFYDDIKDGTHKRVDW